MKVVKVFVIITLCLVFVPGLVTTAKAQSNCELPLQIGLDHTSLDKITAQGTVTNTLTVANPNEWYCMQVPYTLNEYYPSGWTLSKGTYSGYVSGGSSEVIPLTLVPPPGVTTGTWAYDFAAINLMSNQSSNWVTGWVEVYDPANVCYNTVSVALADSEIPNITATQSAVNTLLVTNPNNASCGTNTYLISRGFPEGWNLNIANYVQVTGEQTGQVPFTVTPALNASPGGQFAYDFYVYNSWPDGSGQASLTGYVNIVNGLPTPTPIPPTPTPVPPTPTPEPTAIPTPTPIPPTPTPTPDVQPPTVTITSPVNGSSVPRKSSVPIVVNSQDASGVSQIQMRVNNQLVCSLTQTPYTCSFNTGAVKGTTYRINVTATDNYNNSATASSTVTSR